MILILSSLTDKSTNNVIDWLKSTFIRVNKENYIVKFDLTLGSNKCYFKTVFRDNSTICVDKVKAYWYRRDDFSVGINIHNSILTEEQTIQDNLDKEWNKLKDFIHNYHELENSIRLVV